MRALDPGVQNVWWCPNCGITLRKPPKLIDGERYHSWKCRPPMVRAAVAVQPDMNWLSAQAHEAVEVKP